MYVCEKILAWLKPFYQILETTSIRTTTSKDMSNGEAIDDYRFIAFNKYIAKPMGKKNMQDFWFDAQIYEYLCKF